MSAPGPERGINGPHLARLLGCLEHVAPRYAALARTIRLLVLDGRLPLRTRLPGERELAEALGVSRTTAGAAYAALRDEGFLASRRGAGSWTCLPADRRTASAAAEAPAGDDVIDLSTAASPAPEGALHRALAAATRRAPAAPARALATTRSGCPAARRRRRAVHAPRRADDAGPGVRDRRRAARVHAAAARAGRERRSRDGRAPDVSERARRDPRDRRPAGARRDAAAAAGISTCARRRCARRRRGSRT